MKSKSSLTTIEKVIISLMVNGGYDNICKKILTGL